MNRRIYINGSSILPYQFISRLPSSDNNDVITNSPTGSLSSKAQQIPDNLVKSENKKVLEIKKNLEKLEKSKDLKPSNICFKL